MRYRLPDDSNVPQNRFSKAKLIGSKWTALPLQQERSGIPYKHFMVLGWHEREYGKRSEVIEIEAVLTRKIYEINFKALKNAEHWKMGWH